MQFEEAWIPCDPDLLKGRYCFVDAPACGVLILAEKARADTLQTKLAKQNHPSLAMWDKITPLQLRALCLDLLIQPDFSHDKLAILAGNPEALTAIPDFATIRVFPLTKWAEMLAWLN